MNETKVLETVRCESHEKMDLQETKLQGKEEGKLKKVKC
jgi:hypothetical protein